MIHGWYAIVGYHTIVKYPERRHNMSERAIVSNKIDTWVVCYSRVSYYSQVP
nr:MAG TPA: hypothetical protein [Caudoviricetes sp.]